MIVLVNSAVVHCLNPSERINGAPKTPINRAVSISQAQNLNQKPAYSIYLGACTLGFGGDIADRAPVTVGIKDDWVVGLAESEVFQRLLLKLMLSS